MREIRVGCVLLASGQGQRFGGNKLLTPIGGVPLYQRALDAMPATLFGRGVMTSCYPEILTAGAAAGYVPVENPGHQEGISAGIRLGLAQVLDMDGVLFGVCDQPNLDTDSIIRLIKSFQESPNRVHALSYQGQRGNPVLFPQRMFFQLMTLTGDAGGGSLLPWEEVVLVEVPSAAQLQDVDVPQDIE